MTYYTLFPLHATHYLPLKYARFPTFPFGGSQQYLG